MNLPASSLRCTRNHGSWDLRCILRITALCVLLWLYTYVVNVCFIISSWLAACCFYCVLLLLSKATVFGKNRCDYLINWQQGDGGDGATMAMKQVEINTIAASYGGLSPRMVEFHK